MQFTIPRKIRDMSKRRQKIALKKRITAQLARFVGKPNSELTRAEVAKVLFVKNSPVPHINLWTQPIMPIEHINITLQLTKPQP